ncbi:hypothetical protein CCO04_11270 [Pimelobacter sp. 30-1]|nr:hypothetical protein [Pimelobacter sp. 30-1]
MTTTAAVRPSNQGRRRSNTGGHERLAMSVVMPVAGISSRMIASTIRRISSVRSVPGAASWVRRAIRPSSVVTPAG